MYDYQDDSEDEEHYCGITCIKPLEKDRESIIYGDGTGAIGIFDTRRKHSTSFTMYSRDESGELINLTNSCGITALEVLGQNQVVSGAKDGSVSIWDLRTGGRLLYEKAHSDAVTEVTALGGTDLITSSLDATIKVWDCSNLSVQRTQSMHRKGILSSTRLRTSQPKERIMLSGSRDEESSNLAIFSGHPGQGKERLFGYLKGHTGPVTSLAAVGNQSVISGGGFGCRKVLLWGLDLVYDSGLDVSWGATSMSELGTHRGAVNACCSLTQNAAVTGGSDGSIRIWRLQSKVLATIFQTPNDAAVVALGATVDGSTVVSASNGQLTTWDVCSEHVRSESFLRAAGDESYQRQLAAVRRSLPGLHGEKSSRTRRRSRVISETTSITSRGSTPVDLQYAPPWSSTGRMEANISRPPNPLPSEMHADANSSSRPTTGSRLSDRTPGFAPIPTTIPLPSKN